MRVKDLIHEDKDLSHLVGFDTAFDIDSALRSMVVYYENAKGNPHLPIDSYGINDEVIVQHLRKEIEQDKNAPVMNVTIQDFPNEKGYFMLWHLAVSADGTGGRTVPVFINENGILRPMAGKRIWEALLDDTKTFTAIKGDIIEESLYRTLTEASQAFAYDTFVEMKSDYEKKMEENHRKYSYALNLRVDAAKHIGIDNIRSHKLAALEKERIDMETAYIAGKQICPDFRLEILVHME